MASIMKWDEFQKYIFCKKSLCSLAKLHIQGERGINSYNNSYDVVKVSNHEGPNLTTKCAEYLKRWIPYNETSESDGSQDGRMLR